MKIKPCTIEDEVSGLKITFADGKYQNKIHIDVISEPIVKNRDLFFLKSGEPDGTGSCVGSQLRDFTEDLVQRSDLRLHFRIASRCDFEYPVRCVQQAMDFLLLLVRFNKGGSGKLILGGTTEWTDEAGMGLMDHFRAKYKKEVYADIKELMHVQTIP